MYGFIDDGCDLSLIAVDYNPKVKISFNKRLKETKDLEDKIVSLNEIVDVKGDKAKGNQLTRLKVKDLSLMQVEPGNEWPIENNDTEESILIEEIEDIPEIKNQSTEYITNSSKDLISDLDNTNEDLKDENIKIDTKSEKPIEMEWDVESPSNDEEDLDEDGQMKIF